MTSLILTQPNYLPWRGLIDHLILADKICIYDSIPLPRASGGRSKGFSTRVQVLNKGIKSWLTIPVPSVNVSRGEKIQNISISSEYWPTKHLKTLQNAYSKQVGYKEVSKTILEPLLGNLSKDIQLNNFLTHSMRLLLSSFGVREKAFLYSSKDAPNCDSMNKTMKLINHCKYFECDTYISGLGALNYIDHDLFESHSIDVFYMDYKFEHYPQTGLDLFDPYVTSLDYLCNRGIPKDYAPKSRVTHWRDMISMQDS